MLVCFVQFVPFDMGISMVQSVWSSRGAGLGPSIIASVHWTVSKKEFNVRNKLDVMQLKWIIKWNTLLAELLQSFLRRLKKTLFNLLGRHCFQGQAILGDFFLKLALIAQDLKVQLQKIWVPKICLQVAYIKFTNTCKKKAAFAVSLLDTVNSKWCC